MRNQGDRRGLNPRQLEPQGSSLDENGNTYAVAPRLRVPRKARKIPLRTAHSGPGPDIPRVLVLRRETLRIFAAGVGPDEVTP